MSQFKQILIDGVWKQNPGLVQFLGICPLLAVSNTLVNGLGLGIATLAVLTLSNAIVALLKPVLQQNIRLPVFVLVIATLVTIVERITQAWFFDLWLRLGIFLPLIVTNCVILARAESFASRQPIIPALIDGLSHGLGFLLVLTVLGALRELVGSGTLLAGAETLLGPGWANLTLQVLPPDSGFLIALLPPGAFFGLALLIALHNRVRATARPRRAIAPAADS
ncbi:MAG: electron transport complex subunit E [Gammaproteobacteria bacterium]|jgi:electron transport complex protein RnfE|nr:electron transport complex subunit E [Gammaproteobacteria bacterium]